jgi:hypothetical protein
VKAQTQLQSQIIQLQQTLLTIHEDLLLSTYLAPSSSHSHLVRLIQTIRTVRARSIQALYLQYQRMLPPLPPRKSDPIPGAYPLPIMDSPERSTAPGRRRPSRIRSRSSSSDSFSDHEKNAPKPRSRPTLPPSSKNLFCVYARDLQQNPTFPLADTYKAGGNNTCPYCRSHIAIRPGKAWEIDTDSCEGKDARGEPLSRTFLVKKRFLVKCHREHGGFACLVCARFKDSDTVCWEIAALMEHLAKEHTSEELEKDADIVEC